MQDKPIIVALCGMPTSGKSEIQNILASNFGLTPFDDGVVLRNHCRELFGLSADDVTTQTGKARCTEIQGTTWENRKIIGEYGNILEMKFGEMTIPNWAIGSAMRDWRKGSEMLNRHNTGYSFGSVRRNQGMAYASIDGIVLEILRPEVESTGNVWDEYAQEWVTHTYLNNTSSIHLLEEDFTVFFQNILDTKMRKAA